MALEKSEEPFALERRTKERLQHLIRNVEQPFYWLMLQVRLTNEKHLRSKLHFHGLGLLKRNESVIACGLPENLSPLDWEKRVMISHCEQPKPSTIHTAAHPKAPQPAPGKDASVSGTSMDIEATSTSASSEQASMVGPRKLPLGPKPFGPAPPAQVVTAAAIRTSDEPTRTERKRISPPPRQDALSQEAAPTKPDHRKRKIISPPPKSPPRKSPARFAVLPYFMHSLPCFRRSSPERSRRRSPSPRASRRRSTSPREHQRSSRRRSMSPHDRHRSSRDAYEREVRRSSRDPYDRRERSSRDLHDRGERSSRDPYDRGERRSSRDAYDRGERSSRDPYDRGERVVYERGELLRSENRTRSPGPHTRSPEQHRSTGHTAEQRLGEREMDWSTLDADIARMLGEPSSHRPQSTVVRPLSSSTSDRRYAREPRAEERSTRDTRGQREGSAESSGSDIVVLSQNFNAANVLTSEKK